MSAHRPILPAEAIECLVAAGLQAEQRLLADFAAAGLIKTYALIRETGVPGGPADVVRDAQIPASVWKRIIAENMVCEALLGRTVKLTGSHLSDEIPSVSVTGISFSRNSLTKVLERYGRPSGQTFSISDGSPQSKSTDQASSEIQNAANEKASQKYFDPIKPGELAVSINKTMQVTGLGRTKVNNLCKSGKLESEKVGSRRLIKVESIERLLGTKIS